MDSSEQDPRPADGLAPDGRASALTPRGVPEGLAPGGVVQGPAPGGVIEGVLHALDPRSIVLGRTVGWITTGCVSLAGLVALVIVHVAVDGLPAGVRVALGALWFAGTAGLGWLAQSWPAIEHRHAAWRLDGQVIEIRRGVVWREVITVPRSRVQHTDVSQGPLQRRHGLGTLAIHTAGTDHAQVQLGGLDHATALAIRDRLLPGQAADAV